MDSSELKENFFTGLFEDQFGNEYIRCEFDYNNPIWINVSGYIWRATYDGMLIKLNWNKVNLPEIITKPVKKVLASRLRKHSPLHLKHIENTLTSLRNSALSNNVDLGVGFLKLSARDMKKIWLGMSSDYRSRFRALYIDIAQDSPASADQRIALEIKSWKARSKLQNLPSVVNWHSNKGAFTTIEWEMIRDRLNCIDESETDYDCAIRIFGRAVYETLKRPKQILSMHKDALWSSPSGREHFLKIPRAKGQVGDSALSWQITSEFAADLTNFSEREQIQVLQDKYDRLIVLPDKKFNHSPATMKYGQGTTASALAKLHVWAEQKSIISSRTNNLINLTPYRIRHTGATAMALQGVPRDFIQEILEHDSPDSANAYIEAVGSDLIPVLERATARGLGKIFSELNEVYFFKGKVVEHITHRPITIPIVKENPGVAVVGSCNKGSVCKLHPFWACYNGCPHFLAWREGPHMESLKYIKKEYLRWSESEGGKERSKLNKDFDRTAASIIEVDRLANGMKKTNANNSK